MNSLKNDEKFYDQFVARTPFTKVIQLKTIDVLVNNEKQVKNGHTKILHSHFNEIPPQDPSTKIVSLYNVRNM